MTLLDLTGQHFGRLTVLCFVASRRSPTAKSAERYWLVRCTCGAAIEVRGASLRAGTTRSCGCLHREQLAARSLTHGDSIGRKHSVEHNIWTHMKRRCFNSTDRRYKYYGARGITVCDRWRDSFATFLADMGRRPSREHSLDRRDVNGNYEPSNCRWATLVEQARNKTNNRIITAFGESLCLAAWAERFELPPGLVGERIDELDWTAERALTTPRRRDTRRQAA